MATQTLDELTSFHRFLSARLSHGNAGLSPEECLREWRSELAERSATLAAIQEGLDDLRADRVQSLEDFDREFRLRHNIPEDV